MGELRLLREMIRLSRLPPWSLPALVALGVAAALSEGLGIGLLIPLIGTLMDGDGGATHAGPLVRAVEQFTGAVPSGTRIALIFAVAMAFILIKAVVLYLNAVLTFWLYGRIGHELRSHLAREILHAHYVHIGSIPPGHILDTLATESWHATDAVGALLGAIGHLCMIVVFVVLLFLMSWQLSLVVSIGCGVAVLILQFLGVRIRRHGREVVTANAALYDRMVDLVGAQRMIRAFGQEARELRRFDEASSRLRGLMFRTSLFSGAVVPALEALHAPIFLGVLWLGWSMGMGIPAVLAFLLLLYRLQPSLKIVEQHRERLAALAGSVANVMGLLRAPAVYQAKAGARPFPGLKTAVTFHDVRFHHPDHRDGRPLLAGLSFEIGKGRTTAIVGASGSGKSTLVNLLCRFYEPSGGEIRVDGVPLLEYDVASWRGALAITGQDADLLQGTVHENIAYGCPDADDDAVVEAARLANAHDFILALPMGYDTQVGSRGQRLSGGQRQRIALARALLRNPSLLILDEAMDGLDSASEWSIQRDIRRLAGRLTVVVISHRLSSIRDVDHILVLEDGRIAQQGSLEDLRLTKGPFARFYRLQIAALAKLIHPHRLPAPWDGQESGDDSQMAGQ